MDGQGNISLPSDIGATTMTEWEICELFGVIAPTVRAGIKALCKSGVLREYDIKRTVSGKPLIYAGKLYSEEHGRKFTTEKAGFQVVKDPHGWDEIGSRH